MNDWTLQRVLWEGDLHIYTFQHRNDTIVVFDNNGDGRLDPDHDGMAVNQWRCTDPERGKKASKVVEQLGPTLAPLIYNFRRTLWMVVAEAQHKMSGSGVIEAPMPWTSWFPGIPVGRRLSKEGVVITDANQDGRADFLAFATNEGVRFEVSAFLCFYGHPMGGCVDYVESAKKERALCDWGDWPALGGNLSGTILAQFDAVFARAQQ